MIQPILNLLNVQSGQQLTDFDDREKAWKKIEAVLPMIQFALNQRKSRFTSFSANELMFGSRMLEVPDLKLCINRFKSDLRLKKFKTNDYEYMENFV